MSSEDGDLIKQNEISASTKPTGVRFPARNYNDDWTRTLDAFEILATLGEGTFGWVQKARDRQNGEIVALKKIKMENETEGFPITAIREVKILKQLRDRQSTQNVVLLKEVVAAPERDMNSDDKGSIYLVFEYLEHDLAGLMDLRWDTIFRAETIKCFTKQMLEGLNALHHNKIIHRDIKASNLLVNNEGVLKIADFGLARPQVQEPNPYTANVITLWYRPPELLLAQTRPSVVYSTFVDMWSAGCILAEMLFRAPLFKGKTEVELLDCIFKVLGTPTKETHPILFPEPEYVYKEVPGGPPQRIQVHSPYDVWRTFKPAAIHPSGRLQELCVQHKVPPKTYELLSSLLSIDPLARPKAIDALDHDWFWEEPLPCQPSEVGSCPPSNELMARKHKEDEKQRQQAYAMQHKGSRPPHPTQHHPNAASSHSRHPGHPPHSNQPHTHSSHPHSHSSHHHPPAARGGHAVPHRGGLHSASSSAHSQHPHPSHRAPPHASTHHSASASSQARGGPSLGGSSSSSAFPLGGPSSSSAHPSSSYSASRGGYGAHPPYGQTKPLPPSSKPPPPSSTPPPHASHNASHTSNSHTVNSSHTNGHHPSTSHVPNAAHRPTHPAPSSSSNAPHYAPGAGFKHNPDNANKRYQTEFAPLGDSNGSSR